MGSNPIRATLRATVGKHFVRPSRALARPTDPGVGGSAGLASVPLSGASRAVAITPFGECPHA